MSVHNAHSKAGGAGKSNRLLPEAQQVYLTYLSCAAKRVHDFDARELSSSSCHIGLVEDTETSNGQVSPDRGLAVAMSLQFICGRKLEPI